MVPLELQGAPGDELMGLLEQMGPLNQEPARPFGNNGRP